jgi:hypothetical protein
VTPSASIKQDRRRRWSGGRIATVLGLVIAFLSLVVGFLQWQLPKNPSGGGAGAATPAPPAQAAGTTGPLQTVAPVFFDQAGVKAEAGDDKLVDLPRAVRDKPDYNSHAIAIKCPSNQTGDDSSDVTYPLLGRYVQLDATVHPYYPPNADQQSTTYVFAFIDTRQRDNSLYETSAGEQRGAGPGNPLPLNAATDKAEKLTIRVQCGDPDGIVVLTGVRLTPGR